MFIDPINPTAEEIRAWAGAPDATEPSQDWDLILESDARDDLYLELASDSSVPQWRYFLHLLYLLAGNEVRFTERPPEPSARLRQLLDATEGSTSADVERWRSRVLLLIAHPETFSYTAAAALPMSGHPERRPAMLAKFNRRQP
jgi:hypothetical protein